MTMRNKQTLTKKSERHRSVPVSPATCIMETRWTIVPIFALLLCVVLLVFIVISFLLIPLPLLPCPFFPSPSPDTIHRPCPPSPSLPSFLSLPNTHNEKKSILARIFSSFPSPSFFLPLPIARAFLTLFFLSARLFLCVLCSLPTCRIHFYKLCASC